MRGFLALGGMLGGAVQFRWLFFAEECGIAGAHQGTLVHEGMRIRFSRFFVVSACKLRLPGLEKRTGGMPSCSSCASIHGFRVA